MKRHIVAWDDTHIQGRIEYKRGADLVTMNRSLPSTFPANAAYRLDDLIIHWKGIKES